MYIKTIKKACDGDFDGIWGPAGREDNCHCHLWTIFQGRKSEICDRIGLLLLSCIRRFHPLLNLQLPGSHLTKNSQDKSNNCQSLPFLLRSSCKSSAIYWRPKARFLSIIETIDGWTAPWGRWWVIWRRWSWWMQLRWNWLVIRQSYWSREWNRVLPASRRKPCQSVRSNWCSDSLKESEDAKFE